MDGVLGAPARTQRRAHDEAWGAFETGLLGWRTRCGVATLDVAADIRGHLSAEDLADTVVAILIDHSGSMRG